MKKVSNLLYAFMFVLAAVLTSCDKDVETSSLTVDNFPKATITGYVYADTDLTVSGYEYAPAGTQVIVTIPYSYYTGLSNNSGYYLAKTTVDSKGMFSIEVPADADGVTATAYVKFTASQKQIYNADGSSSSISETYEGSMSFSVKSYETQSNKLQLDASTALEETQEYVKITGIVTPEYNSSKAGYDTLSAAQTIVLYNYYKDWSTTVTTSATGTFTEIAVPKNETIYAKYYFSLAGIKSGNSVTYVFDGNQNVGSYSSYTSGVKINISGTTK